jgi:hypothetical protein
VTVNRRWFPDAAEFEHAESAGFSSGRINLPSRTTLIGNLELGSKRYASPAGAHAVRVDWLARVAQSLTERTGAFVQVNGRNAGGDQPSSYRPRCTSRRGQCRCDRVGATSMLVSNRISAC